MKLIQDVPYISIEVPKWKLRKQDLFGRVPVQVFEDGYSFTVESMDDHEMEYAAIGRGKFFRFGIPVNSMTYRIDAEPFIKSFRGNELIVAHCENYGTKPHNLIYIKDFHDELEQTAFCKDMGTCDRLHGYGYRIEKLKERKKSKEGRRAELRRLLADNKCITFTILGMLLGLILGIIPRILWQ